MITAKVICDSINAQGNRLTTFELRYPKFIHSEFMTHRMFSRNASSSRAIPTERLIEEVRDSKLRAEPVFWGKNQKGMQAAEELAGDALQDVQNAWEDAALAAADFAYEMTKAGAHKQIVNRLLEPFSHINVVCSATEYMNFFGLRLDKAAQPEARALAEAMWRAYGENDPVPLSAGEWHYPYVDEETREVADKWCSEHGYEFVNTLIKVSVARCARVSYRSFETGRRSTIAEDLVLYDRLMGAQPLHASPAEHQATPDSQTVSARLSENAGSSQLRWDHPEQHGNFRGWKQYRKMLPGESCAPLPDGYHL